MALVEAPPSDNMRVILCLKFDPRASFDEVAEFKRALIASREVVHSVVVSGSFDFMLEAALEDFAAYQRLLERFAHELATLVERHEANFICRRFMRVADRGLALWVPCRDGRRRIDSGSIDLVRAEGDYVRICCGDQSWLLHDTMHHLRGMLDERDFLTLHRSTLAAIRFIQKLIHRKDHWVALLADGTEQRIAKSHLASVLATLRSEPQTQPRRAPMMAPATPSATAMP